MKVAVYKNLNKNCYSIQCREGENYGKVIAHADGVDLIDPKFVVNQKGREKVVETKRKNVHAFVIGKLAGASNFKPRHKLHAYPAEMDLNESTLFAEVVMYNPYTSRSFFFYDVSGPTPAIYATSARLDASGVYAWGVNTPAAYSAQM